MLKNDLQPAKAYPTSSTEELVHKCSLDPVVELLKKQANCGRLANCKAHTSSRSHSLRMPKEYTSALGLMRPLRNNLGGGSSRAGKGDDAGAECACYETQYCACVEEICYVQCLSWALQWCIKRMSQRMSTVSRPDKWLNRNCARQHTACGAWPQQEAAMQPAIARSSHSMSMAACT